MAEVGHSALHRPQPTQRSSFTTEKLPFHTTMAPRGHTASQAPQAAQCSRSTTAYLLSFALCIAAFSILCLSFPASLQYIHILHFYNLFVKALIPTFQTRKQAPPQTAKQRYPAGRFREIFVYGKHRYKVPLRSRFSYNLWYRTLLPRQEKFPCFVNKV